MDVMQPSVWTAGLAHPGQSHRYSVRTSSRPSAPENPVLILNRGTTGFKGSTHSVDDFLTRTFGHSGALP